MNTTSTCDFSCSVGGCRLADAGACLPGCEESAHGHERRSSSSGLVRAMYQQSARRRKFIIAVFEP